MNKNKILNSVESCLQELSIQLDKGSTDESDRYLYQKINTAFNSLFSLKWAIEKENQNEPDETRSS